MRAKHPGFNCEIVTQFAHELPEIKINQLDVSRVILNLLNNAFYAVKESRSTESKALPSKVTLSTRHINSEKGDSIVITIRDNGQGIPQQIITNIFTPFFTTKPGNEGTGLGLSISRDIIKAHGGEIRVGSEVGKYTEFVISLPVV
jgi:signal transduction histidine kinase